MLVPDFRFRYFLVPVNPWYAPGRVPRARPRAVPRWRLSQISDRPGAGPGRGCQKSPGRGRGCRPTAGARGGGYPRPGTGRGQKYFLNSVKNGNFKKIDDVCATWIFSVWLLQQKLVKINQNTYFWARSAENLFYFFAKSNFLNKNSRKKSIFPYPHGPGSFFVPKAGVFFWRRGDSSRHGLARKFLIGAMKILPRPGANGASRNFH